MVLVLTAGDMAVGQGFEPWELLHSTVFKTAAFDHSATPPERGEIIQCFFLPSSPNLCLFMLVLQAPEFCLQGCFVEGRLRAFVCLLVRVLSRH